MPGCTALAALPVGLVLGAAVCARAVTVAGGRAGRTLLQPEAVRLQAGLQAGLQGRAHV